MTQFIFANNVNTTLAAAVTSSSTTLTLASSNHLPSSIPSGSYLALTLNDAATRSVFEIVYATSISGATVTVIRGQEGTTAQNWQVGDYIYASNTAGILSSFAPVEGSANNPFAVAPASSSAPQNAPQYGQMFQLLTPSASGNISLSALSTIVVPTATAAITLTMEPGTTAGQWCEIVGTGAGVTVQSNVSSGNPVFTLPDGTNVYSFPLSSYGASLILIWDGLNWRVQTVGQTVVATTTANNQAPPLSQIQAQFAALNGNANEVFAVANTNASNQAPPLSQIQAQFAALNGNANESFYAYELYADSLQGYGIFNESDNSALVCNSGYTASVNYANNALVPHECAPATNTSEAVTLGQFTSSRNTGGPVIIERPDGLILQFGTGTVTASGTGNFSSTINLPEAFPNAGLFAIGNWGGTNPPGGGSAFPFTTPTTTQVTLGIYAPGSGTFTIAYLAVGY